MFVVAEKKKVIAIMVAIVLVVVTIVGITVPITAASGNLPRVRGLVVLDAGHGGMDGGVVGLSTGTPEAGINLDVAKRLEANFRKVGIDVVMTRNGTGGLYSADSKSPKKDDMKERARIICESKPDLMISIHCNAYPLRSSRGAHVFFKKGNDIGQAAATAIQNQLNKSLPASSRTAQVGDYYVLNCSDYTAVLVECGFLSNAEDEKNLLTESYRETLAYNIFIGAMSALGDKVSTGHAG